MATEEVNNNSEKRLQRILFNNEMDAKFGFLTYKGSTEKIGWLINMQPVCCHCKR